MELVFATNNHNKLKEVKALLTSRRINDIDLKSLEDVDFHQDIEEPFDTFIENARIKAQTVYEYCNKNCFAEDAGIVIESLNGSPGVTSARFAGEKASSADNIAKVLHLLGENNNRSAYFYSVMVLLLENGEEHFFTGKLNGTIAFDISGKNGFGYDPIFIPSYYEVSLANISIEEKNKMSHRTQAINELLNFIHKNVLPMQP